MNRSILLVDVDPDVLAHAGGLFEDRGWAVRRAADAQGGMALYELERPDVVLLGVNLAEFSGLRLLEALRARDADATVIMLTAEVDVPTAVEAMRLGAENFLTRPIEPVHLEAAAERAWEKASLRRRTRYLSARQCGGSGPDSLGSTPLMRDLARQVALLAATDTTVLLSGETGTGKGYIAQLLHARSGRAANPFVDINCAGLTAGFLDSELFGHEKGAFTDAKDMKRGLFEVAHSGTLFLDEIGDLAAELQPKLLKVLESRRFRRLGGTRELEVNVRLVAATNQDLVRKVRDGSFREDLFYRLNVLPLRLPPLRERGHEEIADLAVRLLADFRRPSGRGPVRLSDDALAALVRYTWPGNIRELRNTLERVLLLHAELDEILPAHLPVEITGRTGLTAGPPRLDLPLAEMERRHIAFVLAHHAGNRSAAARTLRISRATLYEKLARYALDDIGRSTASASLPRPLAAGAC